MRVLVLGGGYAGLLVARRLQQELPDEAELTIIDETGSHLVQHEVHRVIRKPDLGDVLTVPLTDLLPGASVRTDRVTAIDPDDEIVHLDDESIEYDAAAVCLGARTADHDIPGIAEHGLPLKSVPDALAIREAVIPAIEARGTVVVGGAGLSGIQVAGELAALADRRNATDGFDVVLLEQENHIAPGFPTRFQDAVYDQLIERSVDVRTDTTVEAVQPDTVRTADGSSIAQDALVWTGGIEGNTAFDGDRPTVRSDLRLADTTFVAGDVSRIIDNDGERVPATAQAAVRAATVCATNLLATLDVEYRTLDRFDFDNLGWLVSVGDNAVAQVGPSILTGAPAKALKATVGVRYLTTAGATREAFNVVRAELYP